MTRVLNEVIRTIVCGITAGMLSVHITVMARMAGDKHLQFISGNLLAKPLVAFTLPCHVRLDETYPCAIYAMRISSQTLLCSRKRACNTPHALDSSSTCHRRVLLYASTVGIRWQLESLSNALCVGVRFLFLSCRRVSRAADFGGWRDVSLRGCSFCVWSFVYWL